VSNGNLRAEYQYDIMDRITSIDWKNAWGATILAFDYQYNAAGMITNVVKNDGLQLSVKSYQYDDLDRLTGEASFAGSAPLRENSYSYDAAGNRLSKQNFDSTVSYTLGAGNRLASWSATSANNFLSARTMRVQGHSSEPIGTDSRWGQLYVSNTVAVVPNVNGTNFWVNSFVTGLGAQKVVAAIRDQAGNVGYATNEIFLTVVTNGAYQYSAAGCVTNIAYTGADYAQTTKLGWDSQYRLASVTSVSSACPELAERVVNYSYDVLGRRMSRTVAGGGDPGFTNVEHYVYAGDQVVADLNASGNLLRTYTWGPGVDNLLALTTYGAETNTYYAVKDHLNSVHALVDEAGQIVERYEYDAWGRVLDMKDASGNSIANHQSAIGNRYLWQGREYDAVTALYYFRARWYDPVSGRWLSKDPIGISGGLNQYVFCSNNPVNFIDPDGLVVTIATRAILAGIAVHSFVDVTDSSGVTLYSGTNEPGNKNDLGVRKNYLPDVNAKINSRVLVPPPPNMTQAQWDAAVRSSGETTLKRHLKRNYAALGGDGGKTSGNCHVVTKEIVEGAGGSIPAGYEPPAAHPGLH
jgi:RHS repeat-associated protein